MNKKKTKNNNPLFILLIIIIIVVVALFVYFIYLFSTYDKKEYDVSTGSVVYDKNSEYVKVKGDAYIAQKFDKNYYLYEKINDETRKYNLGKNAVVYDENDMYVYIYGTAYQVISTGSVDTLKGQTKVVKSSPTKFFKLEDRKYVMVDKNIRTSGSDVLNTPDYVIINLDKKGNPSFANHLVDFKTISQTTVVGSMFSFDVANEKLIVDKTEIDLKNVIGSSNEYEPPKKEAVDYTDEKLEALQNKLEENADTIVGYYDQYFKDVINSVNNLTTSVIGANNNAMIGVNKSDTYYDFVKWLALKSVSARVTTIEVEYSIFDPSDEYQVVYLVVDGPDNTKDENGKDVDTVYHALNKNDSKYVIRNLKPDTPYVVSLSYTKVGSVEEEVEDSVVVTTKKSDYSLTVTKITYREVDTPDGPKPKYTLNYEMVLNPEYIFDSAKLTLYAQKKNGTEYEEPEKYAEQTITKDKISESGVYNGEIELEEGKILQDRQTIDVNEIQYCVGDEINKICTTDANMAFSYKFFNEGVN